MRNLFKGLSRDTFLLGFASFFSDVSTEMLYPLLPIFLTQIIAAPASVVGIVEGIAVSSQYIIQGFSGTISDSMKKRKPLAVLGYTLAAVSKPLVGLSATWPQVLGARFLDRLGAGSRTAPRDALIASSADEKDRGKAFGLEGIGDNFGAFVGPLIAVVLLYSFHTSIRGIFYLTVIPGIIAAILILLVKERQVQTQAKTKLSWNFHQFPKAYWKYLLVTALFGLGNSTNAFLILRTKQIGIPLFWTILIYAFFNLVAAGVSFPSGSLSDKVGRKKLILLAFGIFVFTYLGFAFSTNLLIIAFLFLLYGVFSGIYRAVGKAFAVDLVSPTLHASGAGWYATTVGTTSLLASSIGGFLWTGIAPEATFLYGAFWAVVGTVGLLFL